MIKAENRIGLAIAGDIRDEKFRQELVRRAVEGLSGLDIVVSNAARQQSRESILDVSVVGFRGRDQASPDPGGGPTEPELPKAHAEPRPHIRLR